MAYNYGLIGIDLVSSTRYGLIRFQELIEVVAALETRGSWSNPTSEVFVDGGVQRASLESSRLSASGAPAVSVG
ncbi:uncharacterized protein EDB93DRAFT_1072063, partial [Suillus bovinus]|uniref:uncharacterized protein n=1 Tax=Suillus bovinus TaxID=48563 RepID=UPI001B877597